MTLHGEGIGGVVFLTLYTINFTILLYGFTTRLISFKSVYSFLLFHVCLRLAAQSVAIVTGTKDQLNGGLLVAFFVLGAEGYFSLVLCAYRFLIHHHEHVYPISASWLEGKTNRNKDKDGQKDPWYVRLKRALTAKNKDGKKDPWVMTIIHWTLIGANTIIIVGGTRATGADYTDPDFWDRIHDGEILRATGQAIFLAINILLAVFLFLSVKQDRNPNGTLPPGWNHFFRVDSTHGAIDAADRPLIRSISPDLLVLIIAWPPLIVRGIFGLLQAVFAPINYANPEAYTYTTVLAFTKVFIVMENLFSVLPEWTACCLLCTTMFFKPNHHGTSRQAKDFESTSPNAGPVDQGEVEGDGIHTVEPKIMSRGL
ncbi:hypothetical protein L486_00476 [Kwoniella mangroviensis CBS 10435]|uniref:Uncharacterized protein n=1 Tax=Kwoniella mangroviensis CBS 10435 TaxID=1331196 RepID=A0A1B9IZ69_9TREE|nr:uncharacterized protein I203_06204 [Kwoniella mangroviensis CBS 8507]OCF60836.1 hypothetical protein L486_00476 [Kwoniella mangroviensis CBS 10435]OCF64473.1 hypothetical protein I203_06204 [Kwoniella mangroviensis CBS 8507]OCF74414.1 hypothetical protein I204_04789 [Kwoniella mangroviensis CBS 8886]